MADSPADSIPALLAQGDEDAPAIGAPGREWLSHGRLRSLARRTVASLNAALHRPRATGSRWCCRTGRGQPRRLFRSRAARPRRLSIPGTRWTSSTFYLSDIGARALVDSPGRIRRRAAAAVRLRHSGGGTAARRGWAGRSVSIAATGGHAQPGGAAQAMGNAEAEDVALVLHTSGTTSRPKIVPLRHANVTASAYHIGADAGAGAGRCLPQHHAAVPHPRPDRGHAVQPRRRRRGVLHRRVQRASDSSPGSSEVRPTWYTAVPTMHQAILDSRRATRERSRPAGCGSSAPPPPRCRRR